MNNLWGINLKEFTTGENNWGVAMNANLRALATLVQVIVKDKDLSDPPSSPATGDRYIVADDATGSWIGKSQQIAVFDGSAWLFYEPVKGWRFYVDDESVDYRFDGVAWVGLS